MSKETGLVMKYFVLKPSGDGEHSRASRKAMYAYANEIEGHDPELAMSLRDWASLEYRKALDALRGETDSNA